MSSVEGAEPEGIVSEETAVDAGFFLGLDRVVPMRGTGGSMLTVFRLTLFPVPVFGLVLTALYASLISQVGLAPALVEGNTRVQTCHSMRQLSSQFRLLSRT